MIIKRFSSVLRKKKYVVVARQGDSNKYHEHMFLSRNMENYPKLSSNTYLICLTEIPYMYLLFSIQSVKSWAQFALKCFVLNY